MRFLSTLFLIFAFFLSGCGPKENGKVLARFDGRTITETDFNKRLATLPKEYQSIALRNKKEFIQEMVDEHFLAKEAKRRGIDNDKEVRELVETAEKKISVAKLVQIEVESKIEIDPNEAARFYENNKDQFMTPLLLRCSHILVASREEAENLRRQIEQGADFEEMARKYSLDQTAIRGGDIGFFQKGQILPEFEEVAFQMKKGEVRGPIQSQFGFHIIKLTDRAEPVLRDFKSVKPILERQVALRRKAEAFKTYIEKLRAGAKVVIDEQALATLSPQPIAAQSSEKKGQVA